MIKRSRVKKELRGQDNRLRWQDQERPKRAVLVARRIEARHCYFNFPISYSLSQAKEKMDNRLMVSHTAERKPSSSRRDWLMLGNAGRKIDQEC
jgi:hypothetical protein